MSQYENFGIYIDYRYVITGNTKGVMDDDKNEINGNIERFESFDLELLWECTRCGYTIHRKEKLPEKCPSCNAHSTEFILHKED